MTVPLFATRRPAMRDLFSENSRQFGQGYRLITLHKSAVSFGFFQKWHRINVLPNIRSNLIRI
ncbi:hypothetical protein GGD65_004927 [Bradyrhizobium sp. CIR18]|nr:hypothetical protein [Bradyrhizobium sp. CIR18]